MDEIDVTELSPDKIYHFSFKEPSEQLKDFAKTIKALGVKGIITVGDSMTIEDLTDVICQLPVEYRDKIKSEWNKRDRRLEINFDETPVVPEGHSINPIAHEGTK